MKTTAFEMVRVSFGLTEELAAKESITPPKPYRAMDKAEVDAHYAEDLVTHLHTQRAVTAVVCATLLAPTSISDPVDIEKACSFARLSAALNVAAGHAETHAAALMKAYQEQHERDVKELADLLAQGEED